MIIATVVLFFLFASGARAQNGGFFDHTTSPAVSLEFVVPVASAVKIHDFCIRVGVTHTSIMDLKIVLSFQNVQQNLLSMTVLDQPVDQLDNIDANTEVFFTTYSFHTPSSQMGFLDQNPVSGFFYADELSNVLQDSNGGTWTLTVQDLVDNSNSDTGDLVSFTPIFNDAASCGQSSEPSSSPSAAPMSPVATPAESPTTIPACFSGANLVHVRGQGDIPVDSLSIGDYVKSNDGYTKVYGFLHLHRDLSSEFLQISSYNSRTKLSSFIEVTADHLLFSRGRTIAANQVAVGTILDGDNVELQVTHILKVHRKGVYAPATESGELIVASVRASNYINVLPTTGTPINQHTMAHVFLAPARILAKYKDDSTSMYTDEGYDLWVIVYLRIAAQLNRLPPIVCYIVIAIVLAPLMLVLVLVENASIHFPSVLLCTCLALVVTARYRSRKAVPLGG